MLPPEPAQPLRRPLGPNHLQVARCPHQDRKRLQRPQTRPRRRHPSKSTDTAGLFFHLTVRQHAAMCGRYTQLMSWRELVELYRLTDDQPALNVPARYNVAPSQQVPTVRLEQDGSRCLAMVRWGLVPSWAKDLNIGYKMINARAETVAEKPSFRRAFRKRRCLVPASGFYEWKGPTGQKQPYYITMKDGPMTFAGLWESWKSPEGETVESCTIIVTQANELCARIHDRMPVILAPNDIDPWIYPGTDPEQLKALFEPYPANAMQAHPVSKAVGNVRNDEPELVEPIGSPLSVA